MRIWFLLTSQKIFFPSWDIVSKSERRSEERFFRTEKSVSHRKSLPPVTSRLHKCTLQLVENLQIYFIIRKRKGDKTLKLSEKIQQLRKEKGLSQEELAEICKVSRQSISKWEADIALPETDRLLLLANTFQVSLDVLLKDELVVNGVKKTGTCGLNAINDAESGIYEGIIIKESLDRDEILEAVSMNKVEIWNAGGAPKYWTAIYFTSSRPDFPELLSGALSGGTDGGEAWFADFKSGNMKYIVFNGLVLRYEIGNLPDKERVCRECEKRGVTKEQRNWPE